MLFAALHFDLNMKGSKPNPGRSQVGDDCPCLFNGPPWRKLQTGQDWHVLLAHPRRGGKFLWHLGRLTFLPIEPCSWASGFLPYLPLEDGADQVSLWKPPTFHLLAGRFLVRRFSGPGGEAQREVWSKEAEKLAGVNIWPSFIFFGRGKYATLLYFFVFWQG